MTQRKILDELIRKFQAHLDSGEWREEFVFKKDDSRTILDALSFYRDRDSIALDVLVGGVRVAPVDSLAKEKGR